MDPILQKGLLTNFFDGFDSATPLFEKVAMRVPSTAASENYAWLGAIPRMREFEGERIPEKLKAYQYTLPNVEFEASIEVKHTDIKDDQTGKYGPLARSIGESARLFPDEKVFGTLLPNGFSELAYDGQNFFDTDHPIGDTGSTQSNALATDFDSAGTQFDAARLLLQKMKDDKGRPINNNMNLVLIIPPELQGTAETLLGLRTVSTGGENRFYKAAEILVTPWITDSDSWYLANVAGTVKPLVVQEREFIPFEALEQGSESNFMRKKNYYGTYWRGNFGYGLYQKIIGSTGAG